MAVEMISVRLPAGFNPRKHRTTLIKKISETYGDGFEIDSIDPETNTAQASRQVAITEVSSGTRAGSTKEVNLASGTKPADGDKMAAKLEAAHTGYMMTTFSPFTGKAVLTKLDEPTARCRDAVSAAIGVKPWMVQVKPRSDGGFDLELPSSYSPSKHDKKLDEVATSAVGREGWYVNVDVQKLRAAIIPADPPTFPAILPYAFNAPIEKFRLGDESWAKIPLGIKLQDSGESDSRPMYVDLEAAPHIQLSGTSGSGKSAALNAFIAGVLARGAELAVVDDKNKAVDFFWVRQFCRPGGWGADSLAAAVTTMALIYEEGERRAKLCQSAGVTNWKDLPKGTKIAPIVVIVDELTALFFPEKVPKGLPKDHPLITEPTEINLQKATLEKWIKKTAAELRFVGIKLVLSSQVSSTNTGVDTSLRMNLANKILLGVNPTAGNRRLSLADAAAVPEIPANIKADGAAGRGAGVAELEGQAPCVFKTAFATVDQYAAWLTSRGTPVTASPAPTASQIAFHTPYLETEEPQADSHGRQPKVMQNTGLGAEWMTDPETGERATGFQKANSARHAATVQSS